MRKICGLGVSVLGQCGLSQCWLGAAKVFFAVGLGLLLRA